MEPRLLKKKVLAEVQTETVLIRHFGFQESGGRCPMCGEKNCIQAIEYDPGVNGFECRTRDIEGTVISLFVQGITYDSDSSLNEVAEIRHFSDKEDRDAVLDLASLYLGIGKGSGQLWETDPELKSHYQMTKEIGEID